MSALVEPKKPAASFVPGGALRSGIVAGRGRRQAMVAGLVLVFAIVAIHARGIPGEFLGADHQLIYRSPLVSQPAGPSVAHGLPSWLPRASAAVSLAADRAVWGVRPSGYRLTNLLLHLATSLVLFALGRRWSGGGLGVPLVAALLFGLHPLHVATISSAGARGDLLAALFLLLALLLDERARESPGPQPGLRALSVALYLVASFASPLALVAPLLLGAVDLVERRGSGTGPSGPRRPWRSIAIASLPSIAAWLVLSPPVPPVNRWLAGRAIFVSLRALFLPWPLSVHRALGPASGADPVSLAAVAGAIVLLGLLVRALLRRSSTPPPASGSLDAAAPPPGSAIEPGHGTSPGLRPSALEVPVLLVALPLIALALFPPPAAGPDVPFPLLDSSLYLPAAGGCFLLAWLIGRLAGALSQSPATARRWGLAGSAVVVAALGLLTLVRQPVYATDVSYYAAAATQSPESIGLRVLFAHAAASHGEMDRAIELVKRLLALHPDDARLHLLLGGFLFDVRDLDAAEKEVHEALRLDPNLAPANVILGLIEREHGDIAGAEKAYREALRLDPALAEAHSNLGALLASKGATREALTELRRALELDPSSGDVAANLASLLLDQNLPDDALQILLPAASYSEGNARVHYNLGVTWQKKGERERAIESYLAAIRLDSRYARPRNNLGVLYSEEKRYDEAIEQMREVVALEPDNERAHYNLGLAYRATGRTDLAGAEFAAALKIRPDYVEANRALTALASSGGTRRGSSDKP